MKVKLRVRLFDVCVRERRYYVCQTWLRLRRCVPERIRHWLRADVREQHAICECEGCPSYKGESHFKSVVTSILHGICEKDNDVSITTDTGTSNWTVSSKVEIECGVANVFLSLNFCMHVTSPANIIHCHNALCSPTYCSSRSGLKYWSGKKNRYVD